MGPARQNIRMAQRDFIFNHSGLEFWENLKTTTGIGVSTVSYYVCPLPLSAVSNQSR